MTSTYDPYQDDDAVKIDMSMAYEKPASPFSKAFMQMGVALKNGQFCAINAEEEQITTTNCEKSLNNDTNDTTMDLSVDDSQDEQTPIKKSVSFSETEPLIVDDVAVPADESNARESKSLPFDAIIESKPTVEEEQVQEVVQEVVKEVSEKEAPEAPKSGVMMLVGLLSICVGFYKFGCRGMISDVLEQLYGQVEEESGIVMSKLIYGSSSALAILIGLNTFFATEKRLKACIEFVWGVLICSIIMTGIYFTYDFTA